MQVKPPDRIVRVLTTLVSIVYYGLWVAAVVVLIAPPAIKLAGVADRDWTWGLEVPALVQDSGATVLTRWGAARLEVEDVRGTLELPIVMLPWWLVGVLWTHLAVFATLMLLFVYHLRRIFQRVRAGEPFDAQNAVRLRWLGLLLLALALLGGIAELVTTIAVRRGLTGDRIAVQSGVHFDGSLVLVALVLLALAEIFRRGAELEHEQSLVV